MGLSEYSEVEINLNTLHFLHHIHNPELMITILHFF